MLSVLDLCSTAAWLMACCDIASHAFMMDRLHLFACCTTPLADLSLCPTDSQAPREESWLRPAADEILLRLPCQSDSLIKAVLPADALRVSAPPLKVSPKKASRPPWEQPSLAPSGCVS
jgi:hypothetical protein